MKKLEPIAVDATTLSSELQDLENFLAQSPTLQERAQVLPFFKQRKMLTAALGILNAHAVPDTYASELALYGDYACDAASGDTTQNAFTLIEFEDATEYSIFTKLAHGKTIRSYSARFEHGFSQLVDWAWRLSSERNTAGFTRIFGTPDAHISFLLVIGRDSDLTPDDLVRLRWRSQNVTLPGIPMKCLTFDQVLEQLRRRITFANSAPVSIP